jgi:hypothetical protein
MRLGEEIQALLRRGRRLKARRAVATRPLATRPAAGSAVAADFQGDGEAQIL